MSEPSSRRLVVGIPAHWGAVIPPLQHSAFGAAVLDNQFECLVRRGPNGLIEPLGAVSWEVSPNFRVIRFKIDTRRRFSDGSRLTAADYKRSWEDGLRMKARSKNKSVVDTLYEIKGFEAFEKNGSLEGVRALAEDELELAFDKPARVAVEYLSGHRYAAYKLIDGKALGTGPYSMKEEEGALVLSPNPHYTGNEPRFKQLRIVVTEPDAIHDKLRAGEIDAALFAEKANFPECLEGGQDRIRCVFSQESDHIAVHVNGLGGRLFSRREHRIALQHLIHEQLRKRPIPNELKTGHFRLDAQSLLNFQPGRLSEAAAEELLAEGRAFVPALLEESRRRPIFLAAGRDCGWMLALLRDAGLTLSKQSGQTEFARVLEMIYKTHDADLILGGFSVYNGDPDGLYHMLGRHGAIFSPMDDRPGVSDLLEEGRQIAERARLAPHYERLARAILREVPYVHLGFSSRGVAYDGRKTRVSESFVNRNNLRVTLFEPR